METADGGERRDLVAVSGDLRRKLAEVVLQNELHHHGRLLVREGLRAAERARRIEALPEVHRDGLVRTALEEHRQARLRLVAREAPA